MPIAPKIGRNEPCPCGSGKKYKKCCGREKPAPDFSIPENERTGTPMDEYFALLPFLGLQMQKIIQFEKDGPELKRARSRYEKRYRPGKDEELGTGRRWNVLFYRELFEIPPGEREVWYTRLLGPPEKALSYTTPYIYEPWTRAQFERGVRGLAKDFGRSKASIGVPADRLFAESQKESAPFWAEYTRVGNSPSREMLSSVPSEWPDLGLPHLVNTDREDITLTEMHFRVKDEKAARRKLAALKSFEYDEKADTWTWLKAPSRKFPDEPRTVLGTFSFKEGRLVTETNSRERAARLEYKFLGHLRGLIVLEKTLFRQMSDLPAMSPEEREAFRKENDELNALPEAQEARRQYLEYYYFEKWPRQKVPMLGNVTPLQAAKTEKGRRKLLELLEYYDRMQDAEPAGETRVDINRLRQMLGLPPRAS